MEALLTLHDGKIYAFDAYFGEEFYIFPVYFDGMGAERSIRHGAAIDATRLVGETIHVTLRLVAGVWRIANFEGRQQENMADTRPIHTAMTVYYRRLGLSATAGRAAVKRAYRRLARKYHPDLNTDPAANTRMQQINEAYERILEDMEKRGLDDGE
jgi:DnaJ-domain-containing protein 1